MDIVNLIPMAGEGKRFKDAGYSVPKPLIKVDNLPMVVKAVKSLPLASKNIFIVRKDHLDVEELRITLNKYFRNNLIIEIDYLTDGQASTCLLAEEYIKHDSILNIGACDIGFEFEEKNYFKLLKSHNSFIWTYTNNPNVLINPEMYGWVKLKKDLNEIEYVSCKKPISSDLLNDNVVSGTFTFKKAKICFDAIRKMINANDTINGEFYLDIIFNYMQERSSILKVDKYFSWGTPQELISYKKI